MSNDLFAGLIIGIPLGMMLLGPFFVYFTRKLWFKVTRPKNIRKIKEMILNFQGQDKEIEEIGILLRLCRIDIKDGMDLFKLYGQVLSRHIGNVVGKDGYGSQEGIRAALWNLKSKYILR